MVGSTGTKGDSGGISRYVYTQKSQELMANTETVVVLDVTGPSMNAFYTTKNAITLFEVGTYKIDYFTQLTGTIIVELVPDDVLTLVIKVDRTTSLSFNGSTNTKLSIIKLS